MLDLQSLGQRLQLCVGERERRVRTKARDDVDEMAAAILLPVGGESKRRQNQDRGIEDLEPFRHHADHRVRIAAHVDRAVDDAWIAVEPALPERVRQHGQAVAGRVFVGAPDAAEQRLDPECLKQTRGRLDAVYELGIAGTDEIERHVGDRTGGLERGHGRRDVEVVGRRRVVARKAHRRGVLPDHDEARRILERQPLEQHRVGDAEDRGVGADAERERRDDRGGEAGPSLERAQRETNVLCDVAHERGPRRLRRAQRRFHAAAGEQAGAFGGERGQHGDAAASGRAIDHRVERRRHLRPVAGARCRVKAQQDRVGAASDGGRQRR